MSILSALGDLDVHVTSVVQKMNIGAIELILLHNYLPKIGRFDRNSGAFGSGPHFARPCAR